MDAFLGETDDRGRMPSYGKVAIAAVVGNEDGAHHCAAEIHRGAHRGRLHDSVRRRDLLGGRGDGRQGLQGSAEAAGMAREVDPMLASNAAHLARLLKNENYPGIEGGR